MYCIQHLSMYWYVYNLVDILNVLTLGHPAIAVSHGDPFLRELTGRSCCLQWFSTLNCFLFLKR